MVDAEERGLHVGGDAAQVGRPAETSPNSPFVARVDGRSHPNAGDKVFITPEPNHIHVFDTESGLRLSKKAVAAK